MCQKATRIVTITASVKSTSAVLRAYVIQTNKTSHSNYVSPAVKYENAKLLKRK